MGRHSIKDWTELEFGESVRAVEDMVQFVEWRRIVEMPSVAPQRPSRLIDR